MLRRILKAEEFFPYIILLVPFLLYVPEIGRFAFIRHSSFNDVIISHLPNAIFIHKALINYHQIPLWSNLILSGYPFYADPLSGLFYLPSWLINFFPSVLMVNVVLFIHIYLGGIGLFQFLKSDGRSTYSSLTGAMIFTMSPKIWAHFGAGHITLIYGLCWLPWLFLAERSLTVRANNNKKNKFLSSLIFSQIILADVRMSVYCGLAWFSYSLYLRQKAYLFPIKEKQKHIPDMIKALLQQFMRIGLRCLFSLFLDAHFLLPFIFFVASSTRRLISASDSFIFSLPPLKFINLLFPHFASNAEMVVYPGAVLLPSIILLPDKKRFLKENAYWVGFIILSLLFSAGANLPFSEVWGKIISPSLLRVPSRILLLSGFLYGVLIAAGIEELTKHDNPNPQSIFRKKSIFIFYCFVWVFSISILFMPGWDHAIKLGFLWGSIFLSLFGILLSSIKGRQILNNLALLLFLPLIVLDLGTINFSGLAFEKGNEIAQSEKTWMSLFVSADELFRLYSPSYSMSQLDAAQNSFQLADGINPMQLMGYVRFMENASSVPYDRYSVTIPPFYSGNPDTDNSNVTPSSQLLGKLNVKYVISSFPLNEGIGFIERLFDGKVFVYENMDYLPRAWLEVSSQNGISSKTDVVTILEYTPNYIKLAVEGPGVLHLSEVNYNGWQATVDSARTSIIPADDILRGVWVPSGTHIVEFRFSPLDLWIGLLISASSFIFMVFSLWRCQTVGQGLQRHD